MEMNGASMVSSLDTDDYDPIEHLDAVFHRPSTLSSVEKASRALQKYQDDLDAEISAAEREQSRADSDSLRRIQDAKKELGELFSKVEEVRERAIRTEETIAEMTADIKRLDHTKKNLTLSMTALKRLQMLTTAYEQLRGLSQTRQYRECAQLLQAVIQLMAHFKSYRSIDQIATLSRSVADLQREMLEQVCEDFEVAFAKGEIGQKKDMLAEGCLVMDALGDSARSRLINWYCNTQLREYRQIFRGNEEAGSLDNISRRYSWFKRLLRTYDEEHARLFPPHWRLNEVLANAFCENTREDFRGILSRLVRKAEGQSLNVDLLLSCLQETLDFEHQLERRFTNASRASIDSMSTADEKSPVFGQAISEAFEPYMSVWVEHQNKQLATMIPKYRQQPAKPPDEDFTLSLVMPSSTELFGFYRLTLGQCAKLSPGQSLVDLSKVFAKYLEQYAQQVLLVHTGEKPSGQTPSLQPTPQDLVLVLNTADYCFNTCNQLEEKIKSRIDSNFRDAIDLQAQADAFMGIASAAVRALVRKVEVDLEPTWREMRNTGWSKMESVGDQSTYVGEMIRRVKTRAKEILSLISKQQYARAFCDNLVELIATTYQSNIFYCKPIAEAAAEQMLLDTHALMSTLSTLLSLAPNAPSVPPATFTKRVTTAFTRFAPLLKTIQVRPSPPEVLVQAYLIHIADRSEANFRKVLELKGLPKKEQTSLLELFEAHKASPANVKLQSSNPILAPVVTVGTSTSAGPTAAAASTLSSIPTGLGSLGSSAAASLSTSHLPGRFDPSTFGTAIIGAARDGIDRFGSPALGASSTATPKEVASGVSSPVSGGVGMGPAALESVGLVREGGGNLNENLRSIGKFFKRDIGVRFGGGKVTHGEE